jgi:hypothetical protein
MNPCSLTTSREGTRQDSEKQHLCLALLRMESVSAIVKRVLLVLRIKMQALALGEKKKKKN